MLGFRKKQDGLPPRHTPGEKPMQDTAALLSRVIDALRQVHDPEIPVNIYDLGLIYRVEIRDVGRVEVDMTLTAPACPVAGTLPAVVKQAILRIPSITEARVELVWDPPWTRDRISEEGQLQLGML